MHRGLIAIMLSVTMGLPVLKGCAEEKVESTRTADTDRLYNETNRLALLYADSLKQARDSVTLKRIFLNFNRAVDALNQSVVVDADLHLTVEENKIMNQNMVAVRNIYDKKMAILNPVVIPDSVFQKELPPDTLDAARHVR